MIKKLFVLVFSLYIILISIPTSAAVPAAKMAYEDFADISITVGSAEFKVFYMKKNFTITPFIVGASTYVQIDSILPWLGYSVKYDKTQKVMTAVSPAKSFEFRANSMSYKYNGKTMKFSKTTKTESGRILVPMEEFFKSQGYNIKTDKINKTVRAYRVKSFDTGSFAFYDKNTAVQNFFRFDNKGISAEVYKNLIINELYAFKGIIIGYVYDREQRFNKLTRYENGKFIDIKLNYDIVSTYEFGGCRVFYGYDNADKKYKLYKFDGSAFTLVVDDCYSSVHVNFNNNIILNKYDSNRNYSVVKIEPNWNITEIDTGRTMTEYFISDNWLYMRTKPQEGTIASFMVFNGIKLLKVTIDTKNLLNVSGEISLKDIRICDGRVYAIIRVELPQGKFSKVVKGKFCQLEESTAVLLPFDQFDSDFTLIESYNGRIYLSGSHTEDKKKLYSTFEYVPGTDYSLIVDPKFANKNLMFKESMVANSAMFLTGKLVDPATNKSEDTMFVNLKGTWNYAMDIASIESVIETANGLYLNVKDYDRADPNVKRDSIVFIDREVKISNAAIDFNITNQSVIGNSLVFAGVSKITKRSEVNSHNAGYNELIRDFSVSYWQPVNERVFTGGKQDNASSLFSISTAGAEKLKNTFETKTVLGTKNPNMYLVYGIEWDKASVYSGIKVLYLYDMNKGTFYLLAANVDIKQIIRY